MDKKDLEKQLAEKRLQEEKIKMAFQQVNGQIALLEEQIATEEKKEVKSVKPEGK